MVTRYRTNINIAKETFTPTLPLILVCLKETSSIFQALYFKMFWLTQCSVPAQCQYSSKLLIKLIAEACDPLASVTSTAEAESKKYQRRSNVLFPLILSVIPCFQLGADCLGTSDGA